MSINESINWKIDDSWAHTFLVTSLIIDVLAGLFFIFIDCYLAKLSLFFLNMDNEDEDESERSSACGAYSAVIFYLLIDILGIASSSFIVPTTNLLALTRDIGQCSPAIGTTMNIIYYVRSLFDPLIYQVLLFSLIW